ncbi:MAG: NAD-dependent epimerase/dehydratase family protein [Bordetella sp.]|uniref:NAD-dependent epimerase/dehydratase family protein n=1 Tax=Bordetella sp. TaxID=28081 RepID=UPI003F7B5DA1
MPISVILTGATGMVGEGVLLECLADPRVARVLAINRRPLGRAHSKLTEIVHADFHDLSKIESQLAGYDACFFCLGVSSVGMSEADYTRVTYDLTLSFARALEWQNSDAAFCYVSGAGTDSTERGRAMWARVKGAAENELLRLFRRAAMFRPAVMRATPGQKHLKSWYRALAWAYPVARALAPSRCCTLREVGRAMINAAIAGAPQPVLEVRDIVALANLPASSNRQLPTPDFLAR